jgi:hypothetical protein
MVAAKNTCDLPDGVRVPARRRPGRDSAQPASTRYRSRHRFFGPPRAPAVRGVTGIESLRSVSRVRRALPERPRRHGTYGIVDCCPRAVRDGVAARHPGCSRRLVRRTTPREQTRGERRGSSSAAGVAEQGTSTWPDRSPRRVRFPARGTLATGVGRRRTQAELVSSCPLVRESAGAASSTRHERYIAVSREAILRK